MHPPTPNPSSLTTGEPDPRRWIALAALALPVLLISMDATILGFAIPKLAESLQPTSSQQLWIIDVYSFVLAGLLVTMGTLGDRIGRRKLLILGAVGFAGASLASAWAPSAGGLIAARALLGFAGATLLPSTLSLIRNIFTDPIERTKAIAIWATNFAVGAALGPIVGGFLLSHYWWGSVFLIGVALSLVTAIALPMLVPESRDPNPGRFDVTSSALSIAAMLPFVYGVKKLAEHGLDASAGVGLAIGALCGVAFVQRQKRIEAPMIDVSLFAVPRFSAAIVGNITACFGFAGSLFFVTQYLQLVVGMSAMRAGVQLLPSVAASITMTLLAPRLAARFGAFSVIVSGLVFGAIGFGVMSFVGATGSALLVTVATVFVNGGLAPAMAVSVDSIIASVPAEKAGAGASISETANELGIALGTAVLGSILTVVYRRGIPEDLLEFGSLTEAARQTLGGAHVVAAALPTEQAQQLLEVASGAFADGVSVAARVASTLAVGVAVGVAVTVRRTARR